MSTKGLTKDFYLSILNGAKYFSSGIFQNYLAFIPAGKYIEYFTGTAPIKLWKPNGISEENIENITKSDSNFTPTFVDHHLLTGMNINGHCLIKRNIYIPKKVIYLYISYTLCPQLRNSNINTLGNCLFGSVKITNSFWSIPYKRKLS